MTLVTVMVALGLVGIFALAVVQMASNARRAAKIISTMADTEDLRNYIRARTNCPATKAQNYGKSVLFLYGKNNKPIMATSGGYLTLRDWKIKITSYNAGTGAFQITAQNPDLQGGVKNLFESVPFACK